MGCGGSKAVVPPEPPAEQPPPPEPEPPKEVEETSPSASLVDADALHEDADKAGVDDTEANPEPEQPEPEPEPVPEPEPETEPVYIVEDSSAVPGLGLQLGFLEHFASELSHNATAADVLQQVVLPQTAGGRPSAGSSAPSPGGGRFADLHRQQVSSPTYYVKQQWTGGFQDMINTIKEHVHSMEPDVPLEQVSVWVDMLALDQHHAEQREADLRCVQGALASAKTTLVVMERQAARPHQDQPPAVDPPPPASPGAPSPGAPPGAQQPEQSVCLVMYRVKEGLHGFHPFNSVHVKYL